MEQLLQEGLTALGLPTDAIPSLVRYAELLVEKNKVMNLTAITEPADIATLHFLDCAALLTLADVECVHQRAEEFAADRRESFDLVTSRAVAALPLLCELCLPLVKVGGYFVAMKSVDAGAELDAAAHAIEVLGGAVERVADYDIPGTEVRHRAILIKKVRETGKKYPRAFAKIKKAPL